jgi:hypothetical protein
VIGLVLGLAACSDPLSGLDRLADVDVVASDPAAAALPDADEVAREGFLGTSAATGDVPEGVETPARSGFFSGLIRRAANAAPAAQPDGAGVEVAAMAPATAPRSGPDARDVTYGTVVPFGEIVRVCGAKGEPLGKQIATLGRRGFALYDSNPDIVDKRTFYITGFDDDCPRQFTAANALFGAPSFYETIRYSPAGENMPYAATDQAYDKVKSAVCRAGKNKPCGRQIGKLDGALAFVSAYEFHEFNNSWKEFLIYDGTVLAGAVKSY